MSEVLLRGANIRDPLFAGLAFDGKVSFESGCFNGLQKGVPINLACPDSHFFPPSAGDFGFDGILDMTLLQPWTKDAQCRDWIAFVIKNHVRWIKVHPDIGPAQLLEKRAKCLGGLLAGLKAEIDMFGGEQVRDEDNALMKFLEGGVVRFVWEKTGVERDEFQTQLLSNIGNGLDVAPILVPGRIRHNTAGAFDGFEGAIVLSHGAKHAGDKRNTMLGAKLRQCAPNRRIFMQRIEGDLNTLNTDGLKLLD